MCVGKEVSSYEFPHEIPTYLWSVDFKCHNSMMSNLIAAVESEVVKGLEETVNIDLLANIHKQDECPVCLETLPSEELKRS